MRSTIALLLLTAATAADPAKDLHRYDPTAVTKAEAKKARDVWGPGQWEQELIITKRRNLNAFLDKVQKSTEKLDGNHGATTAKKLCALFAVATARAFEADRERDKALLTWESCLVDYTRGDTRWTLKGTRIEEGQRAATNATIWREFAFGVLALRARSASLLRRIEGPAPARVLRDQMLRAKSPELRAKLAHILAPRDGAEPGFFVKALEREPDPGTRAALVSSLGRMANAGPFAVRIAAFLGDDHARVRIATARALADLHVVAAVGPLIERLAREDGLAQTTILRALESLTRKRFGVHAVAWSAWWEKERDRLFREHLLPKRAVPKKESGKPGRRTGFFGLPRESLRVVYIIDVSGSMEKEIKKGAQSRLEACKTELNRAISELPRNAKFGVVLYAKLAWRWKDELQSAGRGEKHDAKEFYREHKAGGSTNIYDALRIAFEIEGADTMYLLTDGAPTTTDGKDDDTEKIIAAVRTWNAQRGMVIHTIGIGRSVNVTFLKQLAEETHGRFLGK